MQHASKHVDLNPQTEAATVLIEKLTSENADLVEKVINYLSWDILSIQFIDAFSKRKKNE